MKIYFVLLFICCCCTSHKKLIDSYNSFSPVSITYVKNEYDSILITDSIKIFEIVNEIMKARKIPSKFIVVEELIIKNNHGDLLCIKRNKEFLKIEGVTYVLKKHQSKKIDTILKSYSLINESW
jgi:hypothetical protein